MSGAASSRFILTAVVLWLWATVTPSLAGTRLTFDDLPLGVKKTVLAAAPQPEIQRIYHAYNGGRVKADYYVVMNAGKKRIILWMTDEGKVLSRKDGPIPVFEEQLKPPAGSVLYGVYEGKIPCEDCEKVKISLTLHQGEERGVPTAYLLQRVVEGKVVVTRGKWNRVAGTGKYRNLSVVRLEGDTPPEYCGFLAVGDNLLLLLDADLEPRVGDSAYSYTLSRTE